MKGRLEGHGVMRWQEIMYIYKYLEYFAPCCIILQGNVVEMTMIWRAVLATHYLREPEPISLTSLSLTQEFRPKTSTSLAVHRTTTTWVSQLGKNTLLRVTNSWVIETSASWSKTTKRKHKSKTPKPLQPKKQTSKETNNIKQPSIKQSIKLLQKLQQNQQKTMADKQNRPLRSRSAHVVLAIRWAKSPKRIMAQISALRKLFRRPRRPRFSEDFFKN